MLVNYVYLKMDRQNTARLLRYVSIQLYLSWTTPSKLTAAGLVAGNTRSGPTLEEKTEGVAATRSSVTMFGRVDSGWSVGWRWLPVGRPQAPDPRSGELSVRNELQYDRWEWEILGLQLLECSFAFRFEVLLFPMFTFKNQLCGENIITTSNT